MQRLGPERQRGVVRQEALAQLRTKAHLREYFDVVLLDQDMPGMTGMQLAAKIRKTPTSTTTSC